MVTRLVLGSLTLAAVAPAGAAAVTPQVPSVAISIGMSPASPRAGSDVRLTGGAGAASYEWDLDGDGLYDDATGLEITARFPAGTQTVRARAVTPVGLLTDSRTFVVHDWNVAPGGTVGATPYSARVGVPVKIEAEGRDPDGLHVLTALDLDGDGSFETAGAIGTATFATPGERTIRARFTDDAGATSIATTTLDVHAGNIAPTAEILPTQATTTFDGAIADGRRVKAVDPDGEIVRYEFDLDLDGTFETDMGRDGRIPSQSREDRPLAVRVTDDAGAVAVARAAGLLELASFPRVVQVGTAVPLSIGAALDPDAEETVWDADGDGAFDDGTGNRISFTYPTTGTFDVRVRSKVFGTAHEQLATISVREAADIAVPDARWRVPRPVRAGVEAAFGFTASAPGALHVSADRTGDGVFAPVNPTRPVLWTFAGPATIALKASDDQGRTTRSTTQVPFVPGNLGPDASMRTTDVKNPLQALYKRDSLHATGADLDEDTWLTTGWDIDADGDYDDGPHVAGTSPDAHVAANFGVRVTDGAGVSTTLRRSITEIEPVVVTQPRETAWLTLSVKRQRLATLLRRGLTVKVTCAKPKCKTRLVATLDAKPARKLKLRSRTVATRTVSGTTQATVKLTAKARRALKRSRSVKLTLTATATAEGGARTVHKQKLTIRR